MLAAAAKTKLEVDVHKDQPGFWFLTLRKRPGLEHGARCAGILMMSGLARVSAREGF